MCWAEAGPSQGMQALAWSLSAFGDKVCCSRVHHAAQDASRPVLRGMQQGQQRVEPAGGRCGQGQQRQPLLWQAGQQPVSPQRPCSLSRTSAVSSGIRQNG